MSLDASGNDAFREISRVSLQRLKSFRLESLNVTVIHRGCFREDLFFGHRGEQARLRDAHHPFLAQLRSVLPQVRDEFSQEL